jgi:hypothetical protein
MLKIWRIHASTSNMGRLPEDGSSSGTPVTDALESLMKRRAPSPSLARVTEQEEDNGHNDDEIAEMAELDMNATGGRTQ